MDCETENPPLGMTQSEPRPPPNRDAVAWVQKLYSSLAEAVLYGSSKVAQKCTMSKPWVHEVGGLMQKTRKLQKAH